MDEAFLSDQQLVQNLSVSELKSEIRAESFGLAIATKVGIRPETVQREEEIERERLAIAPVRTMFSEAIRKAWSAKAQRPKERKS